MDVKLVEQALAGDPVAFEACVRKYARLVYACIYAIVKQHEEAEDLTQETFVRAMRFRVRLREPQKFPQWLLAIARNLARDALRRRKDTVPILADDEGLAAFEYDEPGLGLDRSFLATCMYTALAGLPNRHREALEMRYLEGLDHRTIENRMGLSNGALRGILGRGLAKLRERLDRYADDS